MTKNQKIALLQDFLSWTGGWDPESEEQVDEYLACSYPGTAAAEAREFLMLVLYVRLANAML